MKKIAKKLVIAVLVLSMVLGVFAGCTNPADDKSLAQKYGITMSDKTITYDGTKHEMAISVDNTLLQGKTYTVTYDVNGTVVTKVELVDAGVYEVTAKVKVDGDETVYPLKKNLTILKADLSLEVGNLFLRQLQSIASLGNPRDLFKDAKFVGTDTVAILGTLSLEVYQSGSKVNDLTTLKPTTKVTDGLTVKVSGLKELKNYNTKLSEGKLFVLPGAEYDAAKLLKDEIATVPTSTSINTLDYNSMKAFSSAASHIVEVYPSTNEIQRLMCGTVDVNSVKTLKKTADVRVSNVYDFENEMESTIGKIEYIGASHDRNANRNSDDRLSELKSSAAARKRGEFGDSIAFDVIIYDTTKNKFSHVLINGVEYRGAIEEAYTGPGSIAGKSKVYHFGKARYATNPGNGQVAFPATDDALAYTYTDGTGGNPGAESDVRITNDMLGALSGKTTLTIEVIAGAVHDAEIYNGTTEVVSPNIPSGQTEKTGYPQMAEFTISTKGEDFYRWTTNTDIKLADLMVGKEYKFTITPKTGYGVVSLEIGDKIIDKKMMDENGSFMLTLTEEHLSDKGKDRIVKIIPTFEKLFSFEVKANTTADTYKALANSNKDGVYSFDPATIKLLGVSQGTKIPTISGETPMSMTITPTTGWLITEVIIAQEGTEKDITKDFDGVSTVTVDFSDPDYKNFDSTKIVSIRIKFRESYPIVLKSSFSDVTTTMSKKSDGSYVSDYGTVEIINQERDLLTTLPKDGKYYIRLIGKEGYVPRSVKINDKAVVSTSMSAPSQITEGVRYPMMSGSETNIIINATTAQGIYQARSEDSNRSFANADANFALTLDARLDAGSDLVIEIEYEAYYFVAVSPELPTGEKWQIEFVERLEKVTTGNTKEYKIADPANDSNLENEIRNQTSPLYKVGKNQYYCYYSDKTITARIMSSTKVPAEGSGETNKYVEPIITIGCDGAMWTSGSASRYLKTAVSTAVAIQSGLEHEVQKNVSKTNIAPGGEIEIRLIVDGYEYKD